MPPRAPATLDAPIERLREGPEAVLDVVAVRKGERVGRGGADQEQGGDERRGGAGEARHAPRFSDRGRFGLRIHP